ncbi:GNAT family N-acetyltransferase [Candidatus Bathyarchaeota archaeon]|nr:GNAT family N-acetyltransferase [Candidatus Bathyarchaeota archaeon]MBS7613584.1 GNAT family N-acetyltransferase [Candidatus Bathyarchaeota archaeon]MBS7618828.1 GNAT family N-acetyltransferase [Candidatus Bathyarchaeota archaeon]
MAIKVRRLDEELVERLDFYLRRDPITNFYPLYDLYDDEARRKTLWYVGLKDERVVGFLLIYRGGRVVPASIILDGDLDVVLPLLDLVGEDKAIFHVDPKLSNVVKSKFHIGNEYSTEIMKLKRSEERLCIRHNVELLNEDHVLEFLRLRREWRPSLGSMTDEEMRWAKNELERGHVYGAFTDGQLVSIARLGELLSHIPEVCWIETVFTSQVYRGRGFATSVVSKTVENAFKRYGVKYIGLGVRSDNTPAKRVYEKVGFKKHRDRCWLNLNVEFTP